MKPQVMKAASHTSGENLQGVRPPARPGPLRTGGPASQSRGCRVDRRRGLRRLRPRRRRNHRSAYLGCRLGRRPRSTPPSGIRRSGRRLIQDTGPPLPSNGHLAEGTHWHRPAAHCAACPPGQASCPGNRYDTGPQPKDLQGLATAHRPRDNRLARGGRLFRIGSHGSGTLLNAAHPAGTSTTVDETTPRDRGDDLTLRFTAPTGGGRCARAPLVPGPGAGSARITAATAVTATGVGVPVAGNAYRVGLGRGSRPMRYAKNPRGFRS